MIITNEMRAATIHSELLIIIIIALTGRDQSIGTYPIVGLMFGSKLSSTNLQTILDFPTPVSYGDNANAVLRKYDQIPLLQV